MKDWELKQCSDLNRMLKVRTDIKSSEIEKYPILITIVHRYATSDDILFPEPTTLAFFSSFEEKCLENLNDAIYIAQDIHTGLLKTLIYSQNYKKTIHDTIEFLKYKPEYHIEYMVKKDPNWETFNNLGK